MRMRIYIIELEINKKIKVMNFYFCRHFWTVCWDTFSERACTGQEAGNPTPVGN